MACGAEAPRVVATETPVSIAVMNGRTDHQWLSPAVDMAVSAKLQMTGTVEVFMV